MSELPTNPPADDGAVNDSGWPTLLLATLGTVTLAVAGLMVAVITDAAWALVLAVILVLVGVVTLVTVITALLNDETSSRSH